MNHYPHHIGDFNNATRHLSRLERSIYSDLIDLYYGNEAPLPTDVQRLARLVIAVTDDEKAALRVVLDEFFMLEDDGYHNKRCDEEIEAYQSKVEQASRAGKASAQRRSSGRNANAQPDDNAGSTPVERLLNGRSTNQNQNQNQNQLEAAAREADAAVVETGDEYLTRVTATQQADNRRMVVMADGWQPCEKFEDQARLSGIDPDLLTSDALAKFRIFYDGQERLANRWNLALIDWLKRERPANVADIRAAKPKPVEKKTEYWKPDPKRMMTEEELAVLHAGRALLK